MPRPGAVLAYSFFRMGVTPTEIDHLIAKLETDPTPELLLKVGLVLPRDENDDPDNYLYFGDTFLLKEKIKKGEPALSEAQAHALKALRAAQSYFASGTKRFQSITARDPSFAQLFAPSTCSLGVLLADFKKAGIWKGLDGDLPILEYLEATTPEERFELHRLFLHPELSLAERNKQLNKFGLALFPNEKTPYFVDFFYYPGLQDVIKRLQSDLAFDSLPFKRGLVHVLEKFREAVKTTEGVERKPFFLAATGKILTHLKKIVDALVARSDLSPLDYESIAKSFESIRVELKIFTNQEVRGMSWYHQVMVRLSDMEKMLGLVDPTGKPLVEPFELVAQDMVP